MSNVIVQLFEASGMSIREFATRANLKYSTAHDIVTGKANIENIGAGAFVRIANVFGTTADALLAASPAPRPAAPPAPELTPDEAELVRCFRSMDAQSRDALLLMARNSAGFAGAAGAGIARDVNGAGVAAGR